METSIAAQILNDEIIAIQINQMEQQKLSPALIDKVKYLSDNSKKVTKKSKLHKINALKHIQCMICLENFTIDTLLANNYLVVGDGALWTLLCQHIYCVECLENYVRTCLCENSIPICCPTNGCGVMIVPTSIQPILPTDLYNELDSKYLEKLIIPESLFCPNKHCSKQVILPEKNSPGAATTCPYCSHNICASCRVLWHDGFSCQEYKLLSSRSSDDVKLISLALEQQWIRCGVCHALIDKYRGCNHIACKCGNHFCYRCGKPYRSGKQVKLILTWAIDSYFLPIFLQTCRCDLYTHSSGISDEERFGNIVSRMP